MVAASTVALADTVSGAPTPPSPDAKAEDEEDDDDDGEGEEEEEREDDEEEEEDEDDDEEEEEAEDGDDVAIGDEAAENKCARKQRSDPTMDKAAARRGEANTLSLNMMRRCGIITGTSVRTPSRSRANSNAQFSTIARTGSEVLGKSARAVLTTM
jgi:hypothetical protein